jgi:hypothetical protein
LSLTAWHNLRIDSAEYDDKSSTAKVKISSVKKNAWVEFDLKTAPIKICFGGREVAKGNIEQKTSLMKIYADGSGILEMAF